MNDITMIMPSSAVLTAAHVFQGEYEFNYGELKTVVDIGANIGAFAIFISQRYPDCTINCYEPIKTNFKFLKQNTQHIKNRINYFNVAVGEVEYLYRGQTCCEWTSGNTETVQHDDYKEKVDWIHPSEIPVADLLKIDVEGMEFDILKDIMVDKFKNIVLEYHSNTLKKKIYYLLIKTHDFVRGRRTPINLWEEIGLMWFIKK